MGWGASGHTVVERAWRMWGRVLALCVMWLVLMEKKNAVAAADV